MLGCSGFSSAMGAVERKSVAAFRGSARRCSVVELSDGFRSKHSAEPAVRFQFLQLAVLRELFAVAPLQLGPSVAALVVACPASFRGALAKRSAGGHRDLERSVCRV